MNEKKDQMKESNNPCNLSENQLSMQDKFEQYDELPNEFKNEIASLLPTTDFINLWLTAKYHSTFFSKIQYLNPEYMVSKLLYHVVRGNYEAVITMLENNPSLMCIRGQVKDLSGREFFNMSGFEYCLWALDKHMWTKMLACVPKTQEGVQIMAELRKQYYKIKEHGVTYTLHGVTKHYMPDTITRTEKHFDFEGTIIKELQDYVDSDNDNQWKKGVGGSQRLLPAHVIHEYCSDTPFDPLPDFAKQPASSKEFYNLVSGRNESWFRVDSKLGEDFGIYKGAGRFRARAASRRPRGAAGAAADLNAIKALHEVRTSDFLALEDELKPSNWAEISTNIDFHRAQSLLV